MPPTPETSTRSLRLLVVPGLRDSGPAHWQTWLQQQHGDAVRVTQRDWLQPDLARWSGRIDSLLDRAGPGRFVAVAHSFGVLALVDHLARRPDSPIDAVLLVAPADPDKFGLGESLSRQALTRPATLVASSNVPWMPLAAATRWAARWRCPLVNLGRAGHINAESGFGPLPLATDWLRTQAGRPSLAAA